MCSPCRCKRTLISNSMDNPQVWQRTGTGFRIETLTEPYFERALDLFKEYYIPNDLLCQASGLPDDEVSTKSFLKRILQHLKIRESLIAIDESLTRDVRGLEIDPKSLDDIAGILVLRVIKIIDYGRITSQVRLTEGDAQIKCVRLRACLNKKMDVYAKFKCNNLLRYYDLCVVPRYRSRGLGFQMLKCGLNFARSRGVSTVMGIFTTLSLQTVAHKIGMEIANKIDYKDWKDSGTQIFENIPHYNKVCALMVKVLPPLPPFPPSPPPPPPPVDKKGKKGKK